MRVRVTSVNSNDKIPSDDELSKVLQSLINNCHQLIAVNFISDGSGEGTYTVSYQDYQSTQVAGSCLRPVAVQVQVISVVAASHCVPSNDQLAAALQSLLDECHQVIAVTAVCDGRGKGQYKISFLDYSSADQPERSEVAVSFANQPAAFAFH
jgi:ribosomal protein S24E